MLDDENPTTETGATGGETEGADASAAPAPRKRAARKTAAKRTTKKAAAAPPADEAPAEAVPGEGEPGAPVDEAPAEKPAKKAAKRTRKKATSPARKAAAGVSDAAPDSAEETPTVAVDAPVDLPAETAAEETPVEKPAKKAAKRTRKKAVPAVDPAEAQDGAAAADASGSAADESAASAPAVLFQAPEKPARRTRKKAAPQPVEEPPAEETTEDETAATEAEEVPAEETPAEEVPAGESADETPEETEETPADESAEETSEDSDEDDEESGSSRRRPRRRGGRRRRRSSDDAEDGDDEGERGRRQQSGRKKAQGNSSEESSDDAEAADGPSDDAAQGDGDADKGEGSSRRRRRRRRSGGGGDKGGDDAKPRQIEDEITAVSGSTRLEAKKQRRREGREAGRRRAPIVSEAEFLARRESVDRKMVIRQRQDLTQIAVLEDKVLVEHYVARESQTSLIGNVYLGRVQNVLPSMEAAFIDIGKGRNAVLYAGEVNWKALGHKDGQPRKIESVLQSGQTVLVQVSKDPVGHKGARLTSQVSLPGRFLVYVPDGTTSGISRKLPDTERARLKALLKEIVPDSAGVIVRTAAEGASEEELTRDVERLTARWSDIEAKVAHGNSPQLLYGEPDLTLKVVRDLFTEDFTSLVIQGDDAWDIVDGYVSHVAPDLRERLQRHDPNAQDDQGRPAGDVFAAYRIDEQIAKGLDRKVWLPSGGSLIIDRTEAMTVVDVNTGKFTGSGGNLEETVTKNNLESAEEIVRQLRLRDIGGIIVIDFIDMVLESNRDLVLRRLVECLGRDRTRHQVAEVTSLGLVQMTRKRIGTGLLEAFSTECEHCKGRGLTVHDMPIEPSQRGGGNDDGGRGGRNRRGGRGRNDGGQSSGGQNNGGQSNGGQSNGNGSNGQGSPSPKDVAAMSRAERAEAERAEESTTAAESTTVDAVSSESPTEDRGGRQDAASGEERRGSRRRRRGGSGGSSAEQDASRQGGAGSDQEASSVAAAPEQPEPAAGADSPAHTPDQTPVETAPAATDAGTTEAPGDESPAPEGQATEAQSVESPAADTQDDASQDAAAPAAEPEPAALEQSESRPAVTRVVTTRRRSARRAAGPPVGAEAPAVEAAPAAESSAPAGASDLSPVADGVAGEEPAHEDEQGAATLFHVPIKRKGSRKR